MTRLSDILVSIFTDPRPCQQCSAPGPSFPEGGAGKPYCLICLTAAVEADIAEQKAERQEMARLACWDRRLTA